MTQFFCGRLLGNYTMPEIETWHASEVWYEDDAHVYFHLKKINTKYISKIIKNYPLIPGFCTWSHDSLQGKL